MRLELACVILGAILLARGDARPQQIETNKTAIPEVKKEIVHGIIDDAKKEKERSRVEVANGERELNHYQHIDQALRTVTTQLLNVSGSTDMSGAKKDPETETKLVLLPQQVDKKISQEDNKTEIKKTTIKTTNTNNEKNDLNIVKKNDPELVSIDLSGRPVNSKYHYLDVSHPGQAMALTDEELEIELASTRSPSFHRNPPVPSTTTAGGISTWVQVNPPKTTSKPLATTEENENNNIPTSTDSTQQITTQNSKSASTSIETESTPKAEFKTTTTTTTIPKIPTAQTTQKVTIKKSTTAGIDLSTATTTTTRSVSDSSTTFKSTGMMIDDNDDLTTTKKIASSSRNSSKSRPTTISPKTTTIKSTKPTPSRPSKPLLIRKPSIKNDVTKSPLLSSFDSTSKIEKVTYKPIQTITTPKNQIETMQNPVFIKKIHASFHTDSVNNPSTMIDLPLKNDNSSLTKSKIEKTKPQLKKPIDTPTTIEIEPIKVNAPVLHIERVEDKKKYTNNKDKIKDSIDGLNLENSQIDVKFDFNPDAMKLETPTEITTKTVTTTTMASTTSTTKKPKGSSKRKKHKTRRRKPSSSSSTTASSSSDEIEIPSVTEILEEIAQNVLPITSVENSETSLQESKVVPDTKSQTTTTTSTNNKNTKNKKQVAKPIGTQIYNYFSREVMPSFGVMSLVGIGLGLASYFLYPFGGVIARRSDQVGPHYNYNTPGEYGGNYGQKEEEVFSKVLQGMSPGDDKYGGIIDYEKNHYRYKAYDSLHGESYTTKKDDVKYQTPTQPTNYRLENTPLPYEIKYRNTEFKYPDLTTTTTTPNYYEHHQKQGIDYSQNHRHQNYDGPIVGSADRQFVVGSIPKEYSKNEKNNGAGNDDNKNLRIITTTESLSTDFEKQIAQSMKFLKNPLENIQAADAQPLRADGFDEVEITPTAVAVEHGPRSLKFDDESNDAGFKKRIKRDSVIQLIPTRSEIEKEEHEEDLSNEIFNIIDSALPPDNFNADGKKNYETTTTDKPREELTTSTTKVFLKTKEIEVEENSSVGTTTTETVTEKASSVDSSSTLLPTTTTTEVNLKDSNTSNVVETFSTGSGNTESTNFGTTAQKPGDDSFNAFNFVKKIAEVKFRLGLTILKRASESFAKYLGHVQKRLNGEE